MKMVEPPSTPSICTCKTLLNCWVSVGTADELNVNTRHALTQAPSRSGRKKCSLQWGVVCPGGDRLVPLEPLSALVAPWHELPAPTDMGGGSNGEVHEKEKIYTKCTMRMATVPLSMAQWSLPHNSMIRRATSPFRTLTLPLLSFQALFIRLSPP